ncbi:MFS transporter [Polynucleobacter sp. SHI8]|uniref:MFS transporter n=1 Tax=unclassified Polynucleobacter TaxID=2640945 RepID=UPI002491B944|nr:MULTISPECIES: MFS transporter [unclassified Polynucleobacter]BDW11727.1 MFS transporter [Polynucleobacter sp. SHI2]BDW14174.1 MFS transporter [Polynucleobacter sp. SHI8]
MTSKVRLLNKNILLLAICQGLYLTNNVTFLAINGLVGFNLTPIPWMATLPLMAYVLGAAISTIIVAKVQEKYGRKKSFQFALLVVIFASLVCACAAYSKSFILLIIGTAIAGYYSANGLLYRFVAPELTQPSLKEKAVSIVLAGGLIGAVLGPNLSSWSKNIFDTQFLGAYLILAIAGVMGILIMQLIDFPDDYRTNQPSHTGRPLKEIILQPTFLVALICASLGYGVMNLMMAGTPLAMQVCGFDFPNTAQVLQYHVIGMFAPGFFTGHLVKRYGPIPIMTIGAALNFISIFIMLSGSDLPHFIAALFLLGVAWNFLFNGSTILAISSFKPEEKNKAEATINFCVFGTMAISSFSSGALVTTQGWQFLNIGTLVPTVIVSGAIIWLVMYQKRLIIKLS